MRGINKGQTVHIMIIPEVKDLIIRELGRGKAGQKDFSHWKLAAENAADKVAVRHVLCDISAWLVVNSMRSERVQFNQLCIQNVANVYRKGAFGHLLSGHTLLKISHDYDRIAASESGGVKTLLDSLQVFCEPIDFALEECVPDIVQFSESIRNRVAQHSSFVKPEDSAIIDRVISWITAGTNKQQKPLTGDSSSRLSSPASSPRLLSPDVYLYDEMDRLLGAEMVQEQEQEQEQEKEQEQEQEIEIEKYVDLAYSREHEEPTPWLFNTLKTSLSTRLPQFYPASEFKLYKRKPLYFPEYCMVSNNYFDCRWSGARRIKNVVIVLDWAPDLAVLEPVHRALDLLSDSQRQGLDAAFDMLDLDNRGSYSVPQLQQLLRSALHLNLSESEAAAIAEECNVWDKANSEGMDIDQSVLDATKVRASCGAVKHLLLSGRYSQVQRGRCFVCLSLAEAETIRCIMHRRIGEQLIAGSTASIALRCVPTGFTVIDESGTAVRGSDSQSSSVAVLSRTNEYSPLHCPYMTDSALESFRFLNCELFFSERSLNILLRALHGTGRRDRRLFFKNIIGCRRRLAKKWNEYSVAKLFTLSDYFGQLKQRATSVCLREAIQERGMLLYDAFNKFNYAKNGLLSPAEVWGTFQYLGVEMTAMDILDFVNAADMDRDGNISYRELVDILSDPDKQGVNDEEDSFVSGSVGLTSSLGLNASQSSSSLSRSAGDTTDSTEDIAMPSKPVPMRRQVSLNPVLPRGEDELTALKKYLMDQEEAAERAEAQSEGIEEQRIRAELEVRPMQIPLYP
jgi:Ca2+-binding EF-hand superfamily protein